HRDALRVPMRSRDRARHARAIRSARGGARYRRGRDASGEMDGGESEPDDDHEREAGEREIRRATAGEAARTREQKGGPDGPARETTSSTAASGITARPSSRYGFRQPQIRYAPTTSQTKRLSEPAQVPHGKPSSRAACTPSRAVCASQPRRTPQVAARPAAPGRRAAPR